MTLISNPFDIASRFGTSSSATRVRLSQRSDWAFIQQYQNTTFNADERLFKTEYKLPLVELASDPNYSHETYVIEQNWRLIGFSQAFHVHLNWQLFQSPWHIIDTNMLPIALFDAQKKSQTLLAQGLSIIHADKAQIEKLAYELTVISRHHCVLQHQLKGWCCFVAPDNYHRWATQLSFRAYVQQVEARSIDDRRLGFHLRLGGRIGAIFDSSTDTSNMPYVLMLYDNPYH